MSESLRFKQVTSIRDFVRIAVHEKHPDFFYTAFAEKASAVILTDFLRNLNP